MRQFPLGPWWHKRTLACQEQAMENQSQTADVQLKETRKARIRNVKQHYQVTEKNFIHFDYHYPLRHQFPSSSVGDELECENSLFILLVQMKTPVFCCQLFIQENKLIHTSESLWVLLNQTTPKSDNWLKYMYMHRIQLRLTACTYQQWLHSEEFHHRTDWMGTHWGRDAYDTELADEWGGFQEPPDVQTGTETAQH